MAYAQNEIDDIRLSIIPAVEMLEVLRRIQNGLPWKERASSLLLDRAYRYMMFTSTYTNLDLMEILSSLSGGNEPKDRFIGLCKVTYRQLSGYLKRLDDLSTFLDELESVKEEISSKAAERARRYLLESNRIEADIYLVIGGSDAYGVNLLDTRAIVMDVGQFVFQMEELLAMMAHELHHKAGSRDREIYWRFHRNGPKDLERAYELVSELIGEGIATLVTFPYGLSRKYSAVKPKIDDEYEKVEEGIKQICQDITNERADEIVGSLYNNAGPLYMVGCDMARKIEDTLGRERLIAVAQEPLPFFQAYEEAVTKSGEGYEFSTDTMDIIRKLQGQIDLM